MMKYRLTWLGVTVVLLAATLLTSVSQAQEVTDQTGWLDAIPATTFSNVTTQVGLVPSHDLGHICGDPEPPGGAPPIGSGSAWGDFDNDGRLDLFVTNMGSSDHLYRNMGDTNGDLMPDFTDVAASLGVASPTHSSMAAVFIDYDNDGDQDLFVTQWGGNSLFKNMLRETNTVAFVEVTAAAGLVDGGRAITSAWGDFDQDGDLDVYLAKHLYCGDDPQQQDHLYSNNGDGTFTDVTGWLCPSGVAPCDQVMGLGFTAGWFDYDNDGDSDLYLVNDILNGDYYHNVLWRNDGPDGMGGWLFSDVTTTSGTGFAVNGMGLGIGDYDLDGWMDIAFSNVAPGKLLHNNGDGTFTDVTDSSGASSQNNDISWGTAFFDYDNNGWLDLLHVRGFVGSSSQAPDSLLRNNGDGTFTNVAAAAGINDPGRGRSASLADFNGDGFVDVFIGNYGQAPGLYKNSGDNGARWLAVSVEGTQGNRDGIGTRIYLTVGDRTHMRDITSGPTHGGGDERAAYFGMRGFTKGRLMVRWPSGQMQDLGTVNANQRLHLVEPTSYTNVSVQTGVNFTHQLAPICGDPDPLGGAPPLSAGSAWGDYDNDGRVDLFVTNMGGADRLYHNVGDTNGDALPDFVDVAGGLGVAAPDRPSLGVVFIDYDNDGDQDIYVNRWGGNTLYQNQLTQTGSVSFVDVTATAGVVDGGRAVTSAWADFDRDGYLDFYVAKHKYCSGVSDSQDHLFHNNGDGTFSDATAWLCGGTPSCAQVLGLGFTAGWVDYDNDADLDLYLVNDNIGGEFYHNVLWRNDGSDGGSGWVFTDVSAESGTDFSVNGMGLGVGDYNNDGWMDLAFSNIAPGKLLRNAGDGTFEDVSNSSGVALQGNDISWATAFFDYDNNGWLDLYMARGYTTSPAMAPDAFFRNNRDGTFSNIAYGSGLADPARGRNASMVDFDRDGFVDLFIGNYGAQSSLYHNAMASIGGHWLAVTVEGTISNRDAIGARLWLTTGDRTIMRDISSGPTHGGGDERAAYFGLDGYTSGHLKVRWPSGVIQDLGEVTADQRLHLVEPKLPASLIYVSPETSGVVDGIAYNPEDILAYDTATGHWSMHLDGSAIGLTTNISAFVIMSNGRVIMSFSAPTMLPGIPDMVDDSDMVQYIPSTGQFRFLFDGSDVGLTTTAEAIDGIALSVDSRLVISTVGHYAVPGVAGGGEDVLKFFQTRLGPKTTGSWQVMVDGSAIGGGGLTQNVTSVEVSCTGQSVYLGLADYMGHGPGLYAYTPSNNLIDPAPVWQGPAVYLPTVDGVDIREQGCAAIRTLAWFDPGRGR